MKDITFHETMIGCKQFVRLVKFSCEANDSTEFH